MGVYPCPMERSVWTDERLNDRFDRIDRELAMLRSDVQELRSDMNDGFTALRSEMQAGFGEIRSFTLRLQLGTLIPVLGLIAALIARG